jgi:anti-sigma B factor antagonist/stage II sporulation protein AA (anti-sigma F factor antagonist)
VDIQERRLADVTVLTATGRLDQDTSAGFQARLVGLFESAAGAKVALDFAGLDYISSVGLRALMVAAKKAKANGGAIAVAALTPVVREIFEISRFTFVVPVFADLRAALASMSAGAAAALDAGG